ncbi:MAG TPA: P-II family nitrogen regulator [Clostridiales bacterium]|nr:P-II family nitrogen regulator [Clostridiales bacterium]
MSPNQAVEFELVCVIVNFGLGSKILKIARRNGISGGTVFLGRGTVNNKILEFLGLSDIRKEIVIMLSNAKTAEQVIEKLDEEFHFEKPNHGIAFTAPVSSVIGVHSFTGETTEPERSIDIMYQTIMVIVEKGKAEEVIDAATKAGSKGGTIINARGAGIHETSKLFSMEIEPEKEIVLIIAKADKTDDITQSIRKQLKIDEPGNGIIFIQDVNRTYGLYEE